MNALSLITIQMQKVRMVILWGKEGIEDDQKEEEDYNEGEEIENMGGYMNLYDCRIDNIDEIITLKETLEFLKENNQGRYARLMTGVADEDGSNRFK